jgi:tubulin--tyrosine ligase-like protein 12
MDELGSSIRHSNTDANVCCTSFFFAPSQTMFTIFYPIVRVDEPYSEIFRNFAYDNNDTLDRTIRLLPWQHLVNRKTFLRSLMIEHNPELFNKKLYNNLEIYEKCHKNDLRDKTSVITKSIKIDQDRIWKVYTDHELVQQYLTDEHYQLVDNPDQADILFIMKQLEDFRHEIINEKLINQFPFENIVTNKELLALVARRWKSLFP